MGGAIYGVSSLDIISKQKAEVFCRTARQDGLEDESEP